MSVSVKLMPSGGMMPFMPDPRLDNLVTGFLRRAAHESVAI